MTTRSIDKVDISRILIHPGNGSASGARVTSMEAANSVLQSWAQDTSGRMPDEYEVEIIFEDGLRYCGHYHLKTQENRVSLGRHVRRRLTAMTKAKAQCLKRAQQAANDAVIGLDDLDPAECAKAVLEHYNI